MATMSVFTLDMVLREMQVNWKITVDTKTKQKKKILLLIINILTFKTAI